jgi:Uma2 family endonuclease
MAEAGVLGEDDRVELIGGEILDMSPIGRRHTACVKRLNRLLSRLVGDAAIVSVQDPVLLSEHDEPEPDLALLRPRPDFYASVDVTPDAVLLVIEVADSSVEYDRQVKAPLYARGRIPELWIVDLVRDHVAVYRDPTSGGYGTTRVARRGETISPSAFAELTIAVDEILG